MNIRAALKHGISQLREGGIADFTLAAELLLLHSTKRDRTSLYSHPDDELAESELQTYQSLIQRRISGEPTQHLTGKQEFWGLEFIVSPDVLIPRPETEHLIEVALDRLALREVRAGRTNKNDGTGLVVADVGTGSGCIAVSLAKELPRAEIYATDTSAAALSVARNNAARHAVSGCIRFLEANLLRSLALSRLRFDLIVSNPPYIGRREAPTLPREVRDHEPELALYGGEEGYELYADLIAQSAARLKPGGLLVVELGHDSLSAVEPLLEAPLWLGVGVTNDLAGIARVIAAERSSDNVVDTAHRA
jgi:release factor glutamine methyltransferase